MGFTIFLFEKNLIKGPPINKTIVGNYFFTSPEGDEVKVEYSFGYFLAGDGSVRINLHHSSMPYSA